MTKQKYTNIGRGLLSLYQERDDNEFSLENLDLKVLHCLEELGIPPTHRLSKIPKDPKDKSQGYGIGPSWELVIPEQKEKILLFVGLEDNIYDYRGTLPSPIFAYFSKKEDKINSFVVRCSDPELDIRVEYDDHRFAESFYNFKPEDDRYLPSYYVRKIMASMKKEGHTEQHSFTEGTNGCHLMVGGVYSFDSKNHLVRDMILDSVCSYVDAFYTHSPIHVNASELDLRFVSDKLK